MPDGGLLGIPAKIAASYKKGQAAGDAAIGNEDDPDELPNGLYSSARQTKVPPGTPDATGRVPIGGDPSQGYYAMASDPGAPADPGGYWEGHEGNWQWHSYNGAPDPEGGPDYSRGGENDEVPDPEQQGERSGLSGWFNRG